MHLMRFKPKPQIDSGPNKQTGLSIEKVPFLGIFAIENWAKKGLIAILAIYAGVIFWTFGDYGITPDEGHHIAYGESVVLWYTTGFQERSIFTWADVWLYGGFYDTVVHLITRVSPLELYDTRHLCNAFAGFLGVLIAYRVGALFGSPWIGLLSAVFLVLTPRFYGHAFNNNKDIPFAVLYLLSLYWQMKVLSALPRVPWRWVWVAGLVTGLAMGIRVGGVLLVGYAGLFWGAWYIFYWRDGRAAAGAVLKDYVLRMGVMAGMAYGVMLIFWPWAQTDPLHHPLQALTVFSKFPGGHLNFFEGQYFHSHDIPWYYAPKWLLLTLPEFVLIGLLFGLGMVMYRSQNVVNLQTGFLGFAALFPLFYLIIAGTPLYNAIRHFLFVVPPLVILSAWGVYVFTNTIESKWRAGIYGLVGILLLVTASDMVRVHPFQTVFFNRIIAGGIPAASFRFDTDNYNNGYKQGVRWLLDHAEEHGANPIRVAGGGALDAMLDMDRFVIEDIAWKADYYITTTNMQLHTVIPGEVVHTVAQLGVPLLYVIRPDTTLKEDPLFAQSRFQFRDITWANLYRAEGRWQDALALYEKASSLEMAKAEVFRSMGSVYQEQKAYPKAVKYYQMALGAGANSVTTGTELGNNLQEMGDIGAAVPYYERALGLRPNYLGALTNLGGALFSMGRYQDAVEPLEKVVCLVPDQSIHFQRLGLVYYQVGRTADAIAAFEKSISLDPRDILARYHLGLALERAGNLEGAESVYLEALTYESHRSDILLRLASIYQANESFDTAVRVLMTLLEHHPTS